MNVKNLITYHLTTPLDLDLIKSQSYENVEFLPCQYKNRLKIQLKFSVNVILSITSTTITPHEIDNKNIELLKDVLKTTFNIELSYDIHLYFKYKVPEAFVIKHRFDDGKYMKEQLQLDFNIEYKRDYLVMTSKSLETLETVYHYIDQLFYNF